MDVQGEDGPAEQTSEMKGILHLPPIKDGFQNTDSLFGVCEPGKQVKT
jgi:hypothetical protein